MDIKDIIRKHFECKGIDVMLSHLEPYTKAVELFKQQKFRQIVSMEYQLEQLGDYMKDVKLLEEDLKHKMKLKTARDNNNQYAFITVNPKPEIELETFLKKLDIYVNRQICQKFIYVVEQRGETLEECGRGLHAHILVERNLNYKPCKFIQNTKNTFKNLVGNDKHIHIQICGEDYKNDKIIYITGKNKDVTKSLKQDYDIIFRKNNNIPEYYGELF